MKLYLKIMFILIVFLKTETLFSENNLFNVNNIELEKKVKTSNKILVDQAIKKGFNQLIAKILLKEDEDRLSDLTFSSIRRLVRYYQVKNISDEKKEGEFVNFSVTFDKDKIHDLFYQRGISYSEISDKELYILPLLVKNNEVFIFNNNFFYKYWNDVYKSDLIEFILPLENIEIIQNINVYKNNLINLNVVNLFEEYQDKNLAVILIEENQGTNTKIYIKSLIQGKNISKNLNLKKQKLVNEEFNKKLIVEIKKELINLVKSKNLIDIRTPNFLNVKFDQNKKNNLVELNSRIKNIDLIENVYVQEFNKNQMSLKIKYLGRLEKIIYQLKKENIDLKRIKDQWVIKAL